MPVLDGYDDLTIGGTKQLPYGLHDVTITTAKYNTGSKNGRDWAALEIGVTADDGGEESVWIFQPIDSADWAGWKNGARSAYKENYEGLGFRPEQTEDDEARASLIGKRVKFEVKKNGEYRNVYFRIAGSTDAASLPAPPQVAVPPVTVNMPTATTVDNPF